MHKQAVQPGHIPGATHLYWLDAIKGLAIVGILLYHAVIPLYWVSPFDHPKDDWPPLAERLAGLQPIANDSLGAYLLLNAFRYVAWLGYHGTHLFIAASGFGLTWSLAHRSPTSDVDLRRFYGRRLKRILPLYWAAHLFFLLFRACTGQPDILVTDGNFYLSLLGFRVTPATFDYVSPAWWFVGLILQLYLIFPALWAWLRRKGLLHFWVGTGALTLISRWLLLVVVAKNQEMWSMGAICITRLFEFTFGMGLAYWWARQPEGLERLWRARWPFVAAGATYLLATVLSCTVEGAVVSHSLIAASLFVLAWAFCQHGLPKIKPLWQATRWLGHYSYAIMLLHQPILWWLMPLMKDRFPYPIFLALLGLSMVPIVLGSAAFDRGVGYIYDQAMRAGSAFSRLAPHGRTSS